MRTIAGLPVEINKLPELNRVVMCGSFTVRENHVYSIHQSARDYLATYQAKTVLKSSREDVHYMILLTLGMIPLTPKSSNTLRARCTFYPRR
ncbi:hypothetical protein BDW72DRAFT_188524 [Aspergillus terricola var. indicus]